MQLKSNDLQNFFLLLRLGNKGAWVSLWLSLCCFTLNSQDLLGSEELRLNLHWQAKSTFQTSVLDQVDGRQTKYAYINDQLAVIHCSPQTDTTLASATPPSCNLSIFASMSEGEARLYTMTLPFLEAALQEILVTPNGLVCLIKASEDPNTTKACFIPSTWGALDTEFTWLPDFPRHSQILKSWASGTKLYLWLRKQEQHLTDVHFYALDLEQTNASWQYLSPPPAGTESILNVSLQHDGLRNALFVLSRDFSTTRMLKYDLALDQWEKLPTSISIPQELGPAPIHNVPFGSADILYFSAQSKDGANPLFIFHTITESWRSVDMAGTLNREGSVSNAQQDFLGLEKKENSTFEVQVLQLEVTRPSFSLLNTIIIVLYFIVLLGVGIFFSQRQLTENDYFKGGNRIPWWAAGLSIYGTGLSAISFMAVPAKTYMTDWAYFMTKLPLILIPIVVGSLFIPFYKKLDITSAYEYLEKRFNLATRLLGSLTFIIFQLGRIGVVLYLPAIALNIATGWDVILCILMMGGVSLIYTLMGGIEAVVWTDVLQVIVLVGGIILCLTLISFDMEGGMSGIIRTGVDYEKFEIINMVLDWKQPTFWVVVISGFFSNLITYSTDQSMVQRYLTTRDVKAARQSIWTYTWVSLSIGWIFFFVGTALFAFYKSRPETLLPAMASNDAIFPWYIISQLPDGVSGLLIAGIFAAAMSSLSSSMNSAATAYTIDFHHMFGWRGNGLSVGRWATLVIGIAGITFALLFATLSVKSIWDEFLKIIGLITGGLGGVFLLGIISKRANGMGAFVGLLLSGVVQYFITIYQPIHFLLYTASGFLSCLIIGYCVSLLFPNHNKPISGLTIYGD
ncbi:MAG: sodium:solute symporter [Saprospiraceae bacterium]|nr:sodium:solute symporter [Saprospiraceae bacterium]